MEKILESIVKDNSVRDWLISLAIILLTIFFARVIYLLFGRIVKSYTSKTETKIDDAIIDNIERPSIMLVIVLGISYAVERLHFSVAFDKYEHRVFVLLIAFNVTWFVIRIIDAIIENYLVPLSKQDDNEIDDQVVLLVERGIRLLLWTVGIIVGLNNAGFDVGALIAGLGIGGLAVALAAQDTVKNIFGGITIFLDKPFAAGDKIIIKGLEGNVEYIGMRSTRLRTAEGRLITIPNAQFSENPIENISMEPSHRIVAVFRLPFNSTPEKVDEAIAVLKKVAADNSIYLDDKVSRVFLSEFNTQSLDLKFVCFIRKEEDASQVQHKIFKEIFREFNARKIDFAQLSH